MLVASLLNIPAEGQNGEAEKNRAQNGQQRGYCSKQSLRVYWLTVRMRFDKKTPLV